MNDEEAYKLHLDRIVAELAELLPFFQAFFETQVDDAEKPAPEQVMNSIIAAFQNGEWLLSQFPDGTVLGITYLGYIHPGRDCSIKMMALTDQMDMSKIVNYVFGLGKARPPFSFIKINAKTPPDRKNEIALMNAGFQQVGRHEADALLQGRLSAMLSYERFHPTWEKAAGEVLDED